MKPFSYGFLSLPLFLSFSSPSSILCLLQRLLAYSQRGDVLIHKPSLLSLSISLSHWSIRGGPRLEVGPTQEGWPLFIAWTRVSFNLSRVFVNRILQEIQILRCFKKKYILLSNLKIRRLNKINKIIFINSTTLSNTKIYALFRLGASAFSSYVAFQGKKD